MTAHLLGSGTERSQGRLGGSRKFNYAPSLAEAVLIAAGGVPESLRGASVVPFYVGDFSSGVDGFNAPANNTYTAPSTINSSDNWLKAVKSTGGSSPFVLRRDGSPLSAGVRYRVVMTIYNKPESGFQYFSAVNGGVAQVPQGSEATVLFEGVAASASGALLTVTTSDGAARNVPNGSEVWIKNVVVERIGLTSQLTPESIQLAPGQWLDTSGNGKHAYIPDGFRLGAASRSGDLSSVLTWETSSTDPRYVTGVNASAVPANSAITLYARATASGTFNIGDGSNATYYASAVSIGTDWTPITLTSPVNDGTNRKIVLTPTSAYAGSVTISAQVQVLA